MSSGISPIYYSMSFDRVISRLFIEKKSALCFIKLFLLMISRFKAKNIDYAKLIDKKEKHPSQELILLISCVSIFRAGGYDLLNNVFVRLKKKWRFSDIEAVSSDSLSDKGKEDLKLKLDPFFENIFDVSYSSNSELINGNVIYIDKRIKIDNTDLLKINLLHDQLSEKIDAFLDL